MHPDTTKLAACPFCGSGEVRAAHDIDRVGWVVECCGCSVEGPERASPAEAIASWNSRPTEERPREALRSVIAACAFLPMGNETADRIHDLARAALGLEETTR